MNCSMTDRNEICMTPIMKAFSFTLLLLGLSACSAQEPHQKNENPTTDAIEQLKELDEIDFYRSEHLPTNKTSVVHGSVSNGSIENSVLIPFDGKNFHYFDTNSYLLGRAFAHQAVVESLVTAYSELDSLVPNRQFTIMESANEHGGKLFPHRTHQNGMSIDFMMPKTKDGKPDYSLDGLGAQHYLLEFDSEGRSTENPEIELDFNTIALHLLLLDKQARKRGLKINKVIINTSLKDELFVTEYGKELKTSGIYIVQNLTKIINDIHDDHYHVDFEIIN
ncbi:MAG: penicillin-insensitive murein endopeptidase [Flavobacteriaceae bacterium]|jgi:penicillin-insensitive murein endopeptidase